MQEFLPEYVMLGMLMLSMVFLGLLSSQRFGENSASVFGYAAFFGMFLITSVYKQSARTFYPEHIELFKTMDSFIFFVSAGLLVSWMIGVFVTMAIKSQRQYWRNLQEAAHPEFKKYPELSYKQFLEMKSQEKTAR